MKYIENLTGASTGVDDDEPVAKVAQPAPPPKAATPASATTSKPADGPNKKRVDWFQFFLDAGCDMDDCSRYATAFERDKIDEAILPDMKADTLRVLGLREGDIIRVVKAIEKRNWTARAKNDDPRVREQLLADERYAQEVQDAYLRGKQPPPPPGPLLVPLKASAAPNLFAGRDGTLKNNTQRRRPVPTKSTSINVDENTLANASTQLVASPTAKNANAVGNRTPSPNLLDVGSNSSPAVSKPTSGFDDDAWTIKPSSTSSTPAVPAVAVTPPVAPASAPPAPAPAPPSAPPSSAPPAVPAQPPRSSTTSPTIVKLSTELELLQKIAELKRPPSAPAPSLQAPAPPPVPSPSFLPGVAPQLAPQPTGFYGGTIANAPRGPFAPVPANAPVLLQPLIPTNSALNAFVPTRPGPSGALAPRPLLAQPTGFPLNTGFQPQAATATTTLTTGFSSQPAVFQPQPTGFQGSMLATQPTGFGLGALPPLVTQPTGVPFGFGSTPSPIPPVPPMPSQFTTRMYFLFPLLSRSDSVLTTKNLLLSLLFFGFSLPALNPSPQPNFNPQLIATQPLSTLNLSGPPSSSPASVNHSPANVFASMKSGTFGGEEHAASSARECNFILLFYCFISIAYLQKLTLNHVTHSQLRRTSSKSKPVNFATNRMGARLSVSIKKYAIF